MNKENKNPDNEPKEEEKRTKKWTKPEIEVVKVETPPKWSSCSSGSDGDKA